MIISLLEDLGYATAEVLLVEEGEHLDFPRVARIGEATADALERVLGMKPGCLRQSWSEDLSRWQALLSLRSRSASDVCGSPGHDDRHPPRARLLVGTRGSCSRHAWADLENPRRGEA